MYDEINTDLQGDTGTERELKPNKKINYFADYLVSMCLPYALRTAVKKCGFTNRQSYSEMLDECSTLHYAEELHHAARFL